MAINYRPSAVLHERLRTESAETGSSIQQIIEDSVAEHFERRDKSVAAIASGIVRQNRELFDRLADR